MFGPHAVEYAVKAEEPISSAMLCGTGSFKSVGGGETWSSTPPSSPRKKRTKSLNPYSARGLDKFASLIADLEARRAKVMAKAGAQGAATLVRFTYSNSNDWVPIIIRLPDENPKPAHNPKAKSEIAGETAPPVQIQGKEKEKEEVAAVVPKEKNVSAQVLSWPRVKEAALRSLRPRWPVLVAVLMLVCLVVFGRVFAICCTTVGWYMVPAMQGEGAAGRTARKSKSSKTKDYGRRLSSKKSNLK
ncbi:uncharacterized protein LOC141820281 [Curcuma longa]|uniref:uncharacterized protein LOC141820281 n=1 Tax=Curcuma longa TaxID=136217 RepID=UPI003D9DCCA7